jgi:hypothetical protein
VRKTIEILIQSVERQREHSLKKCIMNMFIMFHNVMKSTDISRSTVQYFDNSTTKDGVELADAYMIVIITVFWDVTQYNLVEMFHRFGTACFLHGRTLVP